ncbi:T9SS type A sorting domain-containing protein, partial [Candidatus Fermentibacterales bacterium]|nr:T9SS type A sorting domain-containing protein [Candidatus Fermentibacterales bacterium]
LYTPAEWKPIVALYEHFGTQSYSGTMAMLNRGMHLVNHAGHGSNTSVSIGTGYLDVSDFMGLTNISAHGRVSIWNTIACLSGAFDQGDCLGEAWVNSPAGGGFCMMNTRYGWGEPSEPGDQWSELVDQQFFAEFFVNDVWILGETHAVAKDLFVSLIPSDTHYDWILKELTLFGDPELPMWNAPPDGSLEVGAPSQIGTGSQIVSVTVTDGSGPLEGARVCLMQGDWEAPNVYEIAYTGASGQVGLSISTQIPGIMKATASARNHSPVTVEIEVVDTGVHVQGRPSCTLLAPPAPNPAAWSVDLQWATSGQGASILVLDMSGRVVATPGSGLSGSGTLCWDLRDRGGNAIPAGIYMVRLVDGDQSVTRRLVVLR